MHIRDFLTIDWDDGTTSQIPRVEETNLPNEITYNRYVGQHTFTGPGDFIISCEDPNRNGGILNIPNSINIPMYIYSELTISPFLGGYDNSPIMLIPPVDNGCVFNHFTITPAPMILMAIAFLTGSFPAWVIRVRSSPVIYCRKLLLRISYVWILSPEISFGIARPLTGRI